MGIRHIYIKIRDQYGRKTAIPDCPASEILAGIAGTKTLTLATLEAAIKLGFEIRVKPDLTGPMPWISTESLVSREDLRQILK